jgi:predicted HicB family RNase H-like nuclease
MNTLKHKDFFGVFNYIEDEDILFGKLEGITDLVTFQGQSISEIKNAFEEAVEDYIELCEEVGKKPLKSFKGSFNVRLSSALHRTVAMKAISNNMNLNQFVQTALEKAVKEKA